MFGSDLAYKIVGSALPDSVGIATKFRLSQTPPAIPNKDGPQAIYRQGRQWESMHRADAEQNNHPTDKSNEP
jgi:hypothetical protein